MLRRIIIISLTLLIYEQAFCTDPGVRVTFEKLKALPDDSQKYILIHEQYLKCMGTNYSLSKEIVDEELLLSNKLKLIGLILPSHLDLAEYYNSLGYKDKAAVELINVLEQSKNPLFELYKGNALVALGIMSKIDNQLAKALEYYFEALVIYEKHPLQTHVWDLMMNIGNVYDEEHKYDSANAWYNRSYNIAYKYNDSASMAYILTNIAITYKDAGQWDKSREAYNKVLKFVPYLENGIRFQYNILNAKLLLHENKIEEAINMGEQLKNEALKNKVYDDASIASNFLIDAYTKSNNLIKVIENYKSASIWEDSVLVNEKQNAIQEFQTKYETEKKEIEIDTLKTLKKQDNIIKIGLGFILILVILTAMSIIARIRTRRHKDLELYEKNKRLLEAEKQIADDKFLATKMELDFNQKQLDTYTKSIIDKNMVLEELKHDILRLQSHKETISEEEQLRQVGSLIDQKLLTEEHWSDFKKKFETIHQGFFTKLKTLSPDITNAELRLCCLIKLNLSSREMASMLGISEESVYKTRYRLRKRLMLEHDEELMDALNRI